MSIEGNHANEHKTKKMKQIQLKSLEAAEANAPEGTRFVRTFTIMDDSGTGGFCGFYATPEQEREYNDGMARLAELG